MIEWFHKIVVSNEIQYGKDASYIILIKKKDNNSNTYSHQFRIHTISPSMPFLIFWSGSFAVQYSDHMLSVIICGPIWGPYAVLRSFADIHITMLLATQA